MRIHEHTFNVALGEALKSRRTRWGNLVHSEMKGSIKGGKRADILIYSEDMQPVVVEAAYEGTQGIDDDAISRLGLLSNNGGEIMTSVSLVIPEKVQSMKSDAAVRDWLSAGGELEYALFSLVKSENHQIPECGYDVRFPVKGYISGSVADLADLIELAATPDRKIKQVADIIAKGVCDIGEDMYSRLPSDTRADIAEKVGQPADIHAMRVAACVWLSALALHSRLAGARRRKIPSPFKEESSGETLGKTIEAWRIILDIDYKSVFGPALESLEILSDHGVLAEDVLRNLRGLVRKMNALKLGAVADISSDMFPELATDREVTAAYYTRMEIAELLSGLAFNLLPEKWKKSDITNFARSGKKDAITGGLKIADFSCGTGALLKAAYRQVRRCAEPRGLDILAMHSNYMENSLYGADIQPIAAHLTAAGLAGMHPAAEYNNSNVICTDIKDGKTGSLELLAGRALTDLLGSTAATQAGTPSKSAPAPKKRKKSDQIFYPEDGTFDLCIMNPPYTRPHGGMKIFGVEGLLQVNSEGMSDKEVEREIDKQRLHSLKNLKKILASGKQPWKYANMSAGLASAFCYLADCKLKHGGVLATVLPSTAATQGSWGKFRKRSVEDYSDVMVVSMASDEFQSFSADTNMGEILVCARKGKGSGEITFVNLHHLPRDFVEANEFARALRGFQGLDPFGELRIGEHAFATYVKMASKNGEPWGAAGARGYIIPVTAKRILAGVLSIPGVSKESKFSVSVSAMQNHMKVGHGDDKIGRKIDAKEPRGAFLFKPITRGQSVDLSLWDANATTQTKLISEPLYYGEVRKGQAEEAEKIRARMSTLFIARNLRFTSQKLAATMTESECIGGRGWASLYVGEHHDHPAHQAYCLWLNSIFGLIAMWQCGGKQHLGRATMAIKDIEDFPCPQFSGNTQAAKKAVKIAGKEFSRLSKLPLKACSYAWRDENRMKIDAVALQMIGLDKKFSDTALQNLRKEWCKEPSVHGGQKEIMDALREDGVI